MSSFEIVLFSQHKSHSSAVGKAKPRTIFQCALSLHHGLRKLERKVSGGNFHTFWVDCASHRVSGLVRWALLKEVEVLSLKNRWPS